MLSVIEKVNDVVNWSALTLSSVSTPLPVAWAVKWKEPRPSRLTLRLSAMISAITVGRARMTACTSAGLTVDSRASRSATSCVPAVFPMTMVCGYHLPLIFCFTLFQNNMAMIFRCLRSSKGWFCRRLPSILPKVTFEVAEGYLRHHQGRTLISPPV